MKKIIFSLAAVVLSGTMFVANAQETKSLKPVAGDFATELRFTPFDATAFSLNGINVRGRYFLSDNMAVRLDLGFAYSGSKTVNPSATAGSPDEISKTSVTNFNIFPGLELHFANWNRVSLYGGAALGINMRGASASIENVGNTNGDEAKIKGATSAAGANRNSFGFGINVFTGIDVYVYRNLYVGAEMGLSFATSKLGKYETTMSSGSTSTTVKFESTTSTTNVNFYAIPSFRLGWKF